MDDACLRAVGTASTLAIDGRDLPRKACALLVEYQCESLEALAAASVAERVALSRVAPLVPPHFEEDPKHRAALWKLRKGLYPTAGATKRSGETVVIEDVAFSRSNRLPAATAALQALFQTHGLRARAPLRPCEGRQLPLRHHAVVWRARRHRSLRPVHDRARRAGGPSRRVAQGRARYGPQHRPLRRDRMGQRRLCSHARDQDPLRIRAVS